MSCLAHAWTLLFHLSLLLSIIILFIYSYILTGRRNVGGVSYLAYGWILLLHTFLVRGIHRGSGARESEVITRRLGNLAR